MPDFILNICFRSVDRFEINQVRPGNVPVAIEQLEVICEGDKGKLRIITEPE